MDPAPLEPELPADGIPPRRLDRSWSSSEVVFEQACSGKYEPCPNEEVSAIERHVTRRQRSVRDVIRPGTHEDAEGVARVHVETWQAAYTHVFPRERLAALSTARRAEHWRTNPPIVAEVDGTIVGFVSVGAGLDEGTDGELYAIYVHPDQWGTGVGRRLIAAGEERLRALGHTEALLWVLEDNPRARRFYEAAGWSTDGTIRPIEIFGIEVPEIRYTKTL
jgi:ribosomal protein S18 acetylase RimI-like enzyme